MNIYKTKTQTRKSDILKNKKNEQIFVQTFFLLKYEES